MYKAPVLRIIFFTHYTLLYGANKSLINLIESFYTKGFKNVLVVTPVKGDLNKILDDKGIPNCIIPFKNETYFNGQKTSYIKRVMKFLYNWFIVINYRKKLNVTPHTIIHSNTSATLIGAYFSWLLKIPHIWHVREFGKEDYNINYNFGYKYFQFWLNKSFGAIAISQTIFDKRLSASLAKIKKVIYNGIIFLSDLNAQINTNKKSSKVNNIITFGIIGFISKEKGQEEAINALALLKQRFSNVRLLIAGEGGEEFMHFLKAKIIELKIENRVSFIGYISEPSLFYKEINCLLVCSKFEALGRVTIESMSYGVPVIGYNNAGTSEIITHGVNGFLYKSGARDLAGIMSIIIEQPLLLAGIIKMGYKTVENKFTIEQYGNSVMNLYNHIIKLHK